MPKDSNQTPVCDWVRENGEVMIQVVDLFRDHNFTAERAAFVSQELTRTFEAIYKQPDVFD